MWENVPSEMRAQRNSGQIERPCNLTSFSVALWIGGDLSLFFFSDKQQTFIPKTYLYNFDPLKPHFYIVKLGFTGVYIIFLISAQKLRLSEQKYEKYEKYFFIVRTASHRCTNWSLGIRLNVHFRTLSLSYWLTWPSYCSELFRYK